MGARASFATHRRSWRRCRACPCGVDADWWTPSGRPEADAPRSSTGRAATKRSASRWSRSFGACGLEPRRVRSRHGEHAIFSPDDYRAAARSVGRSACSSARSKHRGSRWPRRGRWMCRPSCGIRRATATWRDRQFRVAVVGAVSDAGDRPTLAPPRRARAGAAQRARGRGRIPSARVGAGEHDRRHLLGGAARRSSARARRRAVRSPAIMVRRFARAVRGQLRAVPATGPPRRAAAASGRCACTSGAATIGCPASSTSTTARRPPSTSRWT